MQINNSSKRNEDLIKTASFFSKENKDYLNESNGNSPKEFRTFGKKKNSNGGDFPVKHSTHLTFGARGKSSTAKFVIKISYCFEYNLNLLRILRSLKMKMINYLRNF